MLLDTGAHGSAVDHELVLAVKRDDEMSITMLLRRGASLDHNEGAALIEAVKHERVELLRLLLTCPASNDSLNKASPHLRGINKEKRLTMARLLLGAKASGTSVDAALVAAVCDKSDDRDPVLIEALIQGEADPAFNDGQSLRYAVSIQDTELLKALMRCPAQVSQGLVSSLVGDIVKIESRDFRYSMMQEAIRGDATVSSITRALVSELSMPILISS